ncbi:prenyltransferase, partial [Micromonospora sp. NPDC003776]
MTDALDTRAVPRDGADPDGSSVAGLLDGMSRDPAGRQTPSVYETGRLVALAPWLTGHHRRLRHLLDGQRSDGGWGAPEGYALVPSLSAVEALLATLAGTAPVEVPRDELRAAARRGLAALTGWLGSAQRISVPDTPAVDVIVPTLIDAINEHLRRPGTDPLPGAEPLLLPAGMDRHRVDAVRGLVASGKPVPQKLLHA